MKRTIKQEAIILRKRSLPNQDKIITLFTENFGKIHVFGKGIKKITSKRLPHIQTANLVSVLLYKKNDIFYLLESFLISGFTQIKKSSIKMNKLYLYFFILERLLAEYQSEIPVYNLSKRFLIELTRTSEDETVLLSSFLNKLLKLLGYTYEVKSFEGIKSVTEEIIHEKLPALDIM